MSIKYELKKPFNYGQELVKEFTINEPQAKHLKKLPIRTDSWLFENMIGLIVELSNEPTSKVELISLPDLSGIMEAVMPFLEGSQEIGS